MDVILVSCISENMNITDCMISNLTVYVEPVKKVCIAIFGVVSEVIHTVKRLFWGDFAVGAPNLLLSIESSEPA